MLQPSPMKYRAPDAGFAKSWYVVAESDEVGADAMLPVSYLDEQLIVYRGPDGKAQVADAYCPHMGAHLASHDGCIHDGKITCPFHKWTFDGATGQCTDIPYTKVMVPASVKLTLYPTCEVDGMIMMWYHPQGATPDYQPYSWTHQDADVPWLLHAKKVLDSTCPFRDLFENLLDVAHVQQLHHSNGMPEIATVDRVSYGLEISYRPSAVVEQFPIRHFVTKFSGVSLASQRIDGDGFGFMIISSATPIDQEHFHQISRLYIRDMGSAEMNAAVGGAFAERTYAEIDQDLHVLNFKKHLVKPALCQGDGPIFKWRRYYEEFCV
jgi:3-ketosteroid 9alpha-monooxygenase subunit A